MNRGTKELVEAMKTATLAAPIFVAWINGRIARLASPQEAASFRAQSRHLCLCRPLKIEGGWIDAWSQEKGIPAVG